MSSYDNDNERSSIASVGGSVSHLSGDDKVVGARQSLAGKIGARHQPKKDGYDLFLLRMQRAGLDAQGMAHQDNNSSYEVPRVEQSSQGWGILPGAGISVAAAYAPTLLEKLFVFSSDPEHSEHPELRQDAA